MSEWSRPTSGNVSGAPAEPAAAPGFFRRNRVDLALVLLVSAVFGPIVAANSAQPASRINLTAALVEHRTVDVAGYPHGVDYAALQRQAPLRQGPRTARARRAVLRNRARRSVRSRRRIFASIVT